VDIRQQDNNNDIHEITSLLNTIVKIEKPFKKYVAHRNAIIARTMDIQRTIATMKLDVKCGENHLTIECTKDQNSPAKCALCAKDHTANFKGCPEFESIFKKSAQKCQPVKDPLNSLNPEPKSNHTSM
jgi:hypothetical protein